MAKSNTGAMILSISGIGMALFISGFITWRYFRVVGWLEESGLGTVPDRYSPVIMSAILGLAALMFGVWIIAENLQLYDNCHLQPREPGKLTVQRKSFREDDTEIGQNVR